MFCVKTMKLISQDQDQQLRHFESGNETNLRDRDQDREQVRLSITVSILGPPLQGSSVDHPNWFIVLPPSPVFSQSEVTFERSFYQVPNTCHQGDYRIPATVGLDTEPQLRPNTRRSCSLSCQDIRLFISSLTSVCGNPG